MSWYTGNNLYPHEVHEGLIDPFGDEDVRRQGDGRMERAFLPSTRPPQMLGVGGCEAFFAFRGIKARPDEEQQDEGFGGTTEGAFPYSYELGAASDPEENLL